MGRNIKTYNRYFSFVLYKEDENQMKSMEYITNNYKYARIEHDKDLENDGKTIKKQHYHIVIYVGKNPRNRKAIAKETNVKENYIEGCNKENMLLYLIHYNNQDKTQYDIEDVDGELQKDLIKLIESKTESQKDKLKDLIDKIYENNWNIYKVTDYCITNNYYELLKQNQYLITKIIQERNYKNVNRELQRGTNERGGNKQT